jgi:hypothetical protein
MSTLAQQVADEAVERVDRNADDEWKARALDAVRFVASARPLFTTDAVWWVLGSDVQTHEPRAMGAVMRRAVKAGVCVPTDTYHRSTRAVNHARPLRVWRSLTYREDTRGVR